MAKTLYIIDGHAQIYRCYYAPFRDLNAPSGEPTRATYVFCQMLLNLVKTRKPDYLVMMMDTAEAPVFRMTIDPQYKANRQPPPDDFHPQRERIVQIVRAAGIPVLTLPGFEADDLMATLARRATEADPDLMVYLVSRDKDLEQLLSARVTLYDPGKDEEIDSEKLLALKGYTPKQAVEIQTLCGDTTDNVPGVKGVGAVTAAKLIGKYGTAEAVVAHADELTPKQRENVLAFAGRMAATRKLVTLLDDVPMNLRLEDCRFNGWPHEKLRPIFQELGFERLVQQLPDRTAAQTHGGTDIASSEPPVAATPVGLTTTSEGAYELIDTPERLDQLAATLRTLKRFAFDTETTSLRPREADLVGIAIAWEAGQACYIPVRGIGGPTLSLERVADVLGPILADPGIAKCGQNLKYDMNVLRNAGIEVRGIEFDSYIASFVLDSSRRSHSLDNLALDLLCHQMIPITDLIGKGKSQITMDQVETRKVADYSGEDADFSWRLCELLREQLERAPALKKLFWETEMPLVEVLAEMEYQGVAVDTELLAGMSRMLADRLDELTRQIHQEAGGEFNIDSPRQLGEILFDRLKLPVLKKTKTQRSTDAETLGELAALQNSTICRLILQHRELSKLKKTYVDTLPDMVCPHTRRIHASFHQTGAITGRLSSSDPNLQNIPVRTKIGREIRRAFVPGLKDHVLLTADYSQIELRMVAHFSGDTNLRRAFAEDQDIHRFVAAQVAGIDPTAVTKEQRDRAKAVNFGILYGQGPFGLARQTGMSVGEARTFIDMYFMRYHGVRAFFDQCIALAKRNGYVETILGRRRAIPDIGSSNKPARAAAERLAVNTVIQGSAADLIKRAMISIHRRILDERRPSRMLIQVHDELVFEVPRTAVESEVEMVRQEMEHALMLDVPIKVDVAWGENWLETN